MIKNPFTYLMIIINFSGVGIGLGLLLFLLCCIVQVHIWTFRITEEQRSRHLAQRALDIYIEASKVKEDGEI